MAIAIEIVGWPASSDIRGSDSSYSAPGRAGKKRGWGDDQQKLLQLMMGPSLSKKEDTSSSMITLDLLGGTSSSSSDELHSHFLDLNPQDDPLPSGWEKRLDLRSGSIHFVNTSLGVWTTMDPRRKSSGLLPPSAAIASQSPHWWQSEAARVITSSTDQSRREGQGMWLWKEESPVMDDQVKKLAEDETNNLELNLNLSTTSKKLDSISVCTLEKVQHALERSQTRQVLRQTNPSSRSEHRPWASHEPAASATSSTSSSSSSLCARHLKFQKVSHQAEADDPIRASSCSVAAVEDYYKPQEIDRSGSIFLTGCKRCLTYIMLLASDPVCPRCGATDSNISFSQKVPEVELKL